MTPEAFACQISKIIINPLLALLFGAALIVFIWGVVQYLGGLSGGEDKEEGRQHMLWGIIGLFIMTVATAILVMAVHTIGANVPGLSCF